MARQTTVDKKIKEQRTDWKREVDEDGKARLVPTKSWYVYEDGTEEECDLPQLVEGNYRAELVADKESQQGGETR